MSKWPLVKGLTDVLDVVGEGVLPVAVEPAVFVLALVVLVLEDVDGVFGSLHFVSFYFFGK